MVGELLMPGYGYIEIEVRLLRQGHGDDGSGVAGSGFGVEARRKLRIEEHDARDFVDNFKAALDPLLTVPGAVQKAMGEVLADDDMFHMQERWRAATEHMTTEKMRAALKVLERG